MLVPAPTSSMISQNRHPETSAIENLSTVKGKMPSLHSSLILWLLIVPFVLIDAKVKGTSQLLEKKLNLQDMLLSGSSNVVATSHRTTAASSIFSRGRRRIAAGRRKLMSSGKGEEEEEEEESAGDIGSLLDVGIDTGSSGSGKGKGEEEEEEEELDEDEICDQLADAPAEVTTQGNDFFECEQNAVAEFIAAAPPSLDVLAIYLQKLEGGGLLPNGTYETETNEETFLQGVAELIALVDSALDEFFTYVEEEADDSGCDLVGEVEDLAVATGELLLLETIVEQEEFSCAPAEEEPVGRR